MSILEQAREKFSDLVREHGLEDEATSVIARPLSTKEAVGEQVRDDMALVRGKEVLMQAEFRGVFGQAFTDEPGNFFGSIRDVMELALDKNFSRAVFVATLNAVTRSVGLAEGTIHCKATELEACGREIAGWVSANLEAQVIGIVGYQPGIVEACVSRFGPERIRVSDLNPDNMGRRVGGVEIWDGDSRLGELIEKSRVILATGTTVVNDSIDRLLELAKQGEIPVVFYGVTIAGVAALLGLPRICPCAK